MIFGRYSLARVAFGLWSARCLKVPSDPLLSWFGPAVLCLPRRVHRGGRACVRGVVLALHAGLVRGVGPVTARELAAYLAVGVLALFLILCSMTAPMLALLPNLAR